MVERQTGKKLKIYAVTMDVRMSIPGSRQALLEMGFDIRRRAHTLPNRMGSLNERTAAQHESSKKKLSLRKQETVPGSFEGIRSNGDGATTEADATEVQWEFDQVRFHGTC